MNNLTAKLKKCQFAMNECTYLGHVVRNGQVRPDSTKLRTIKQYPTPTTKQHVREFLGLTGYYRKFIGDYARLAVSLTDLTKKHNPDRINWTPQCEEEFKMLKNSLCQSPVLMNLDFGRTFILQTDASNRGVGAVLTQKDDQGKERPITYFSKKLLPREERYSTVEKECLALKLGIETFRGYLLGRQFVVQTDHRALVWLDRLKEKNSRLTR